MTVTSLCRGRQMKLMSRDVGVSVVVVNVLVGSSYDLPPHVCTKFHIYNCHNEES